MNVEDCPEFNGLKTTAERVGWGVVLSVVRS